ncbi:Conserved_hypothetical protein [Hexamita inflata]|uniref:Uncharacterized protein n=1 Tax=Hexamita inflata TaxID=28002 RepID=A0AA86UEI4_9EUKA|nr:Conserved hypothetical protein [Hexamita inflata]
MLEVKNLIPECSLCINPTVWVDDVEYDDIIFSKVQLCQRGVWIFAISETLLFCYDLKGVCKFVLYFAQPIVSVGISLCHTELVVITKKSVYSFKTSSLIEREWFYENSPVALTTAANCAIHFDNLISAQINFQQENNQIQTTILLNLEDGSYFYNLKQRQMTLLSQIKFDFIVCNTFLLNSNILVQTADQILVLNHQFQLQALLSKSGTLIVNSDVNPDFSCTESIYLLSENKISQLLLQDSTQPIINPPINLSLSPNQLLLTVTNESELSLPQILDLVISPDNQSTGIITPTQIINTALFCYSEYHETLNVNTKFVSASIRAKKLIQNIQDTNHLINTQEYSAVATNRDVIFVFAQTENQNLSHYFVNLKNAVQNQIYVEREDDFDLVKSYERKQLQEIANENCKALFGYVQGVDDEGYAHDRQPVTFVEEHIF